jgi:hypothetical protein
MGRSKRGRYPEFPILSPLLLLLTGFPIQPKFSFEHLHSKKQRIIRRKEGILSSAEELRDVT